VRLISQNILFWAFLQLGRCGLYSTTLAFTQKARPAPSWLPPQLSPYPVLHPLDHAAAHWPEAQLTPSPRFQPFPRQAQLDALLNHTTQISGQLLVLSPGNTSSALPIAPLPPPLPSKTSSNSSKPVQMSHPPLRLFRSHYPVGLCDFPST
jgi:hypothetical protein